MTQDVIPAETPDIDAMSDEDFDKFKAEMAEGPSDEPVPGPEETKQPEPAPEPEAAKKPEDADDGDDGEDDPDDGDPAGKQETVPHQKFHRANERRKEAEKRAKILEERLGELIKIDSQRLAQQQREQAASQQKPEPEIDVGPDPDADPVGWIKWRQAKDADEARTRHEQEQAQRTRTEQQQAEFNAVQRVNHRFIQATQADPELNDALSFLRDSVAREQAAYGFTGVDLQNRVNQLEGQTMIWAFKNRIPIEDLVEQQAIARGWRRKSEMPAQETTEQVPEQKPEPTPKEVMEEVNKTEAAKQKATSLSGGGAPVPSSELSPKSVVDMTDAEFEAFKKKYGENAMDKVFAGGLDD